MQAVDDITSIADDMGGIADDAVQAADDVVGIADDAVQTMDDVAQSVVDDIIDGTGDARTLNTLTDAQKSRLNSLENTINDHLTEGDFSGTLRDLQGNPVPNGKGGFFDHMGEMKDSYKSLLKNKRGLEGSLKNPNLSEIDRALLQEGLDKVNSYISRIEELFAPYGGIN